MFRLPHKPTSITAIVAIVVFWCSGVYSQNQSRWDDIDRSGTHDSRYSLIDPNYSRLILGPTGRPLKQGAGFFADTWLFFPSISYGITDNATVMAGMSLFPFVSLSDQIFYFAPKFGMRLTKGLDLSVGAIYFRFPGSFFFEDAASFGITYSVATWGKEDYNLTGGLGFGFHKEEHRDFIFSSRPAVCLGGYLRTSGASALILESWVFPYEDFDLRDQPMWLAVRLFNEHIAVDVGVFGNFFDTRDSYIVPWLGAAYNFGTQR